MLMHLRGMGVTRKASLNGEFHRPGFQDVKFWYEIDVSLNA
jgi:hypothetical protein